MWRCVGRGFQAVWYRCEPMSKYHLLWMRYLSPRLSAVSDKFVPRMSSNVFFMILRIATASSLLINATTPSLWLGEKATMLEKPGMPPV